MVYALIMAGGIGSRFWPKSRVNRPKQFLSFIDDKSLIQSTVDRIRPLVPIQRILVSTNADYVELVKEQIPDLPHENIIGEPVAKNTAPCIAFAAALIHYRDPEASMIVLPSDHAIRNDDAFLNDLKTCLFFTEQKEQLVTIGITPTRPETGYGYIQYNDEQRITLDEVTAYPVKTFAEKPDMQTAVKFIMSGDFLWNSGMFFWKTKLILQEIKEHLPVLYHQVELFLHSLHEHEGKIDPDTLASVYHSCFTISIDYGIMEKTENVIVVPSRFDWNDLGSWMAIYELKSTEANNNGNIFQRKNILDVDSNNCYVDSQSDKLIALVGLQGIGVIETEDALLICKLEKSENVKDIYPLLTDDTYR